MTDKPVIRMQEVLFAWHPRSLPWPLNNPWYFSIIYVAHTLDDYTWFLNKGNLFKWQNKWPGVQLGKGGCTSAGFLSSPSITFRQASGIIFLKSSVRWFQVRRLEKQGLAPSGWAVHLWSARAGWGFSINPLWDWFWAMTEENNEEE